MKSSIIHAIHLPENSHMYRTGYYKDLWLKVLVKTLLQGDIEKGKDWVFSFNPWIKGKSSYLYWSWVVGRLLAQGLTYAGTGDGEVVEGMVEILGLLRG